MAGPIRIAILANGSQARREIGQVQSSLGRFGRLGRNAAALGFGALAAGAVKFGIDSVNAERKFSTSMRLIQASTKASESEMKALNDLAIRLGADTSFSAGEAADAMLELAKAGLDTKTIMGGGLAGTLTLAAAGGTDLATASTIASNALNTFNLRGRDMKSVAAALAGGANASSASVESLGQALQQVGPGATNAGLSLQETVAALAAFDSAGIKGSDAGTSLKTMLTRLVPQTDKAAKAMDQLGLDFTNADGSFKSLTEISEQLRTRLSGLSQEQRTTALATIFGSDATRAATVLMREGEGGIRKFIKATNDQSAAQKMAEARMSGTEGALERLSGSIETAQLRLGQELAPAVERGADLFADRLVPAMEAGIDAAHEIGDALAPAAEEITEALGNLAGEGDRVGAIFNDVFIPALRGASEIVGGLVNFIDELPGPIKDIGIQAGIAALVLPRLTAGLTATTGAVTTQIARLQQLRAELTYTETRASVISGTMTRLGGVAKQAAGIGGIMALTSGFSEASQEGNTFSSVLKGAAGGAGIGAMFGPIGALVGGAAGAGLTALTGAFSDTADEAEKTRLELMRAEGFKEAKADADSLRESLAGVVNAYSRIPRAAVEASFTGEDGKLDADIAKLREFGVSMDTIVSATMGNAEALRVVDRAYVRMGGSAERSLATARARWNDAKDGAVDLVTATGEVIKNGTRLDDTSLANLRQEYEDAKAAVDDVTAAQDTFGERVGQNTDAIRGHEQLMRQLARQLGLTAKQYRDLPDRVRTEIEAKGLPETREGALRLINRYKGLQNFRHIRAVVSAPGVKLTERDVRGLQKRYDLTPKQVRTLIRLEGTDRARKENRDLQRELDRTDQKRPRPKFDADTRSLEQRARHVEGILRDYERRRTTGRLDLDDRPAKEKTAGATRDLQEFDRQRPRPQLDLELGAFLGSVSRVNTTLNNIQDEYVTIWITERRTAGGGGGGSGGAPGRTPRLAPTDDTGTTTERTVTLQRSTTTLVRATTTLERSARKAKKTILDLLGSVTAGQQGVTSALEKITKLVEQRVNLKNDKKEREREKRILEHLKDEYAALRRNAKAQERVNRQLQKAQQQLQEIRAWVDQVKQGFIETGNVMNLGQLEDGTVSISNLLEDLRQQVEDAKRFAALIRQLRKAGLNDTSLEQLLAAGPEAGLATAEALASGGQAAIEEINALTAELAQTGQQLGAQMSSEFFEVGLQAAQGIVDGLKARQKELDQIARRLARALARAVKKELGIKSPSRVFRDIGGDVLDGLTLGLDDTYVRRSGEHLAGSLVKGFGTPALDAFLSTGGRPAAAPVEIRVRLTAEQLSRAQRGKEILLDISAAQSDGGRRLAVSG